MMFLRIFKHLLPNARAWRVTVDKRLRQFFTGLSGVGEDVKIFIDGVWLDIFPETTRGIDAWEQQFGLRNTGLTEQQRRDRLSATWKVLGGQGPRYIQDTLQASGFDVYVHEWWEPGTEPAPGVKQCVTPRNPLLWLSREHKGYPLVNKVFKMVPDILPLCGEVLAEAGEQRALCGNYFTFRDQLKEYIVPRDPSKWPYFLYIGGATFGTMARVGPKRKDEFEALCLKICPAQQWLGMLVEYN